MGCKIIQIDETTTAIVCGGPADHVHNEDGRVLLLSGGEQVEDTDENEKKYADKIVGGSVCCTICGHAAIDDAYMNF